MQQRQGSRCAFIVPGCSDVIAPGNKIPLVDDHRDHSVELLVSQSTA